MNTRGVANHKASACSVEPRRTNALRIHVPCLSCQQDLFGLSADAVCPECGVLVSASSDPSRLFFLAPPRLRRILFALKTWLVVVALFVGMGIASDFTIIHHTKVKALTPILYVFVAASPAILLLAQCRGCMASWKEIALLVLAIFLVGEALVVLLFVAVPRGGLSPFQGLLASGLPIGFHLACALLARRIPDNTCANLNLISAFGICCIFLTTVLKVVYTTPEEALLALSATLVFLFSIAATLWTWRVVGGELRRKRDFETRSCETGMEPAPSIEDLE